MVGQERAGAEDDEGEQESRDGEGDGAASERLESRSGRGAVIGERLAIEVDQAGAEDERMQGDDGEHEREDRHLDREDEAPAQVED